ncbi:MAG: fructose-6-phosphate aldolase [Hyphomonadaceae bacterium]|nr:fructose-6-phosphate aldolase [Hyphomonadaceae bacterium]
MKFFVDTADVSEVKAIAELGLLDGVTTNPSLVKKAGRPFKELLQEICAIVEGPVSAEVTALDAETMLAEGRALSKIAPNIVVKLPLTWEGLKACKTFSEEGVGTNVTLCFSANQALLAAKAGASFISPFIGRVDDAGNDGMNLIREIRTIYDNYAFETEVLAASIRSPQHVTACALAGADVATVPAGILQALVKHPLTDKGLDAFLADWKATGQKIV